jgi:iduronate 2-sulfatase
MLNYVDEENRDPLPDEWHASWAAEKIKELEQADTLQPFFLGIGFVRPHTPLYAPQRFFDMFPIDELELSEILENDAEDTHYKDLYPASIKGLRYFRTLKESYGGDAEEGLKHFLQAYLACVAFVDEQVGKVVDAIDNSRFRENTVIIFTADHGWQMGEKDYLFKMSPWEESTRIPLLIRAPGAKPGSTVEHPVSLIDLWPTITELGHLKGDNRKDEKGAAIGGHSLVSFLQDPASGDWEGPDGALSMIGGKSEGNVYVPTFSYRTRDWRYIRYYDGSEELYHNSSDPYEWNNLAEDPTYAQQKAALSTKMDALVSR